MRVADTVTVTPALSIAGALRVPGDKSISHRYALLAAIAGGRSTITNYAPGADCASTLSHQALGAIVSRTSAARGNEPALVTIDGRGGVRPACAQRAARLRQFGQHHAHWRRRRRASLYIDPYRRCFTLAPPDAAHHRALSQMGAAITAGPGDRPPVTIGGADLAASISSRKRPAHR
jgi:5-enolpyruvylshikimate-3-phosphate synthase